MSQVGSFHMTLLYAALTGLLFLILSVRVSTERGRAKVDYGTAGGDERFHRANRAQVNLAEYVAPVLILLLLLEMSGTQPGWVIHVLGAGWVIARVLHGFGLSAGVQIGRMIGSAGTYLILLVLSLLTLYAAL